MITRRTLALLARIQRGPIRTNWHWLAYNFTPGTEGYEYFMPVTLESLDCVDQVMPGYAAEMLTRLEQLGGREKYLPHYDAIIQWLAELMVMRRLAGYAWPASATFEMEPTAGSSKKNPETVVDLDGVGSLGVEVKAPNLRSHQQTRGAAPWQMLAREQFQLPGAVTLPRDNPVKDFLVSADAKFAGFRAESSSFASVLVIVWDDFVNEPLAALMAPQSGLLTPNSFHRDSDGNPVLYPNVDAVVLVRHQHQLVRGTQNVPPVDQRAHFLDWADRDDFPPHVVIPNPAGRPLAQPWLDALALWSLAALTPAAEYVPGGIVMWVDPDSS